jgi:hypothetical protein
MAPSVDEATWTLVGLRELAPRSIRVPDHMDGFGEQLIGDQRRLHIEILAGVHFATW